MFDHLTITSSDYEKSRTFYLAALASLGIRPLFEEEGTVTGFGKDRPTFWVGLADASHEVSRNVHIAFSCDNRLVVDVFYHAAIAAGAKDNGAPGLRPQYHENYYGAFVLDPDGNNIEAVCHVAA